MTICIYASNKVETRTYKTSEFLTKIFGHHYCYQAGTCDNSHSLTCVEVSDKAPQLAKKLDELVPKQVACPEFMGAGPKATCTKIDCNWCASTPEGGGWCTLLACLHNGSGITFGGEAKP